MISSIDNVLRPLFISFGSNLPLAIILVGVLGGLLAFGFTGLFIGPTVLAIVYTLILDWSQDTKHDSAGTASHKNAPAENA